MSSSTPGYAPTRPRSSAVAHHPVGQKPDVGWRGIAFKEDTWISCGGFSLASGGVDDGRAKVGERQLRDGEILGDDRLITSLAIRN